MSELAFSPVPCQPRSLAATLLGLLLAATALAQESEGPRIWWNQSRFTEGLALTGEQRAGMDGVLERHLQARRSEQQRYRQARAAVARAAQMGEWQAAEEARDRLGEAGAELARLEADLVVAVLRLLSADQRAKLQRDFPMILIRPWLLGGLTHGRPKESTR